MSKLNYSFNVYFSYLTYSTSIFQINIVCVLDITLIAMRLFDETDEHAFRKSVNQ